MGVFDKFKNLIGLDDDYDDDYYEDDYYEDDYYNEDNSKHTEESNNSTNDYISDNEDRKSTRLNSSH